MRRNRQQSGNANPVKPGRCFEFLNEWYGLENGGNRGNQYTVADEKHFHLANDGEPKTQKELAESYKITQQTMNNYMRLAHMIPELDDLVQTGFVAPPHKIVILFTLSKDKLKLTKHSLALIMRGFSHSHNRDTNYDKRRVRGRGL